MAELQILARRGCGSCRGSGIAGELGKMDPCECVLHEIFRRCRAAHERCLDLAGAVGQHHGRQLEEYVADFARVSERELTDRVERLLFRLHVLVGYDERETAQRARLDFEEVRVLLRQMKARLGRAYRDVQPHSLFPVGTYFGSGPLFRVICG